MSKYKKKGRRRGIILQKNAKFSLSLLVLNRIFMVKLMAV
jgi:hypothetical protein